MLIYDSNDKCQQYKIRFSLNAEQVLAFASNLIWLEK